MAFGIMEIASVGRTQDYTTIKQNEDNKAMLDQSNLGQQAQRTEEQRATTVTDSHNADWHNKRQDARDKGSSEYAGDGGRRRKKNGGDTDRVVIKGQGGFDIKI